MHRKLSRRLRATRDRDERGAVAITVALCLAAVLVISAMVLDFGLVRVDRQVNRSAADSATLAGLHALNTGDGAPHPYVGVCTAVRYLKSNDPRFAAITENVGWTDGAGTATASGCTDTTLRSKVCTAGVPSSQARFGWNGTWQGLTLSVSVRSGYSFTGSVWAEDALPASSGDTGDTGMGGCDHLAVIIEQSREPALGSLATDSDLVTAVRSVGRVKVGPGDSAPAMLLLKRTGCPILRTGSNSGGSFIRVLGAVSSNGLSQPGTIHADSDGSGCTGGSNQNVFIGNAAAGIVAYAAPLVATPTSPDPAKPGQITSVAAANGAAAGVVRDGLDNVYSSSALNFASGPGTKSEVAPRGLITRRLVDERYIGAVRTAISGASGVFTSGATGVPAGFTQLVAADQCKPTQTEINAMSLTAASSLFINCTSGPGKFIGTATDTSLTPPGLTIPAGRVYFKSTVSPAANLVLPNAHQVYIANSPGSTNAIDLGTGSALRINNKTSNVTGTRCSTGQNTSRAMLFVRTGALKQSGTSALQMCRTTAIFMGGSNSGCVPTTNGTAPTGTPCPSTVNGGKGTGQLSQNGGDIDWTAPDTIDATTDAAGNPTPAAVAAWSNANGPEDLALWSESATDSSTTFNMAGGGLFHVRGVFMVPNAEPFIISGGAAMDLSNAQYIASSIELNGTNTNITMSVDPNSAVTLPDLELVGLVR